MQPAKISTIVYWSTLTVLVLDLLSAIAPLGYPAYFASVLGFWKLLGGIALLLPQLPLLREWAYAAIYLGNGAGEASRLLLLVMLVVLGLAWVRLTRDQKFSG